MTRPHRLDPRADIIGFLGAHTATRQAIVAMLMGHGYPYDEAVEIVGRELLDLVKVGRVEAFGNYDLWRLTSGAAVMEKADAE